MGDDESPVVQGNALNAATEAAILTRSMYRLRFQMSEAALLCNSGLTVSNMILLE
jgi:hypothetical protein